MERIAILAGGGALPALLAETIVRRGGQAHIVAVRGEAGPNIEAYPHTWVTWGSVNAILAALRRESDGTMMIAGSVSRPDLRRLKPDFGLIRHLPKVLAMLRGGDDAVLTRVIRFFESQGLTVKGIADIAPELLASEANLGAPVRTDIQTDTDTKLGFKILDLLADLDVGQAIAVEGGSILAIEGVEGTDRMLARIAALPKRQTTGGVLVKGPKRGQELRVDLPTVGAQTIGGLAEARFKTLVITAGKTLLLEKADMVRRAQAADIAIVARVRDDSAQAMTDDNAGGQKATRTVWTGTMLGRVAPRDADARDARTAAEITRRLAPFGAGAAAVVVRDHVLAIAAAEGPLLMAQRVAALRQWGRGRLVRSLGAVSIDIDALRDDPSILADMIEMLARAKIAGVAVVRTEGVAGREVPATAIAMADRNEMFLVEIVRAPASAAVRAA